MANTARINGFSPVKYQSGAPYNGACNRYAIPTADTTASYAIGDVVQSAAGSDANGVPYVIKVPVANASNFVALGVIVADDPNLVFECSAGTTATNFVQTKTRYNSGIASNTGSDVTYDISQGTLASTAPFSNVVLSSATVATTNTLPVQLLGLTQCSDNTFGAYARMLCRFNNHEF